MADGRIVIDTKINTSGAEKGIKDLQSKLENVGGKLKSTGETLSKYVTAPVVGLGTLGVATFASFDDSMRAVEATMGSKLGNTIQEVEKNTEALRAKAQELGATTAFSASEAADGMNKLALAGWDVDQVLAATGPMLDLASAAQMDLALAADIVSDQMTAFGMEASEATRATDVFAKVQSSANTDVGMLGEALKYAGSNAAAAGMDLEQTSAILGVLANASIKGSSAGTTMNAMLRDLRKNAEDGKVSFGEFEVELYNADGTMRDLGSVLADVETGLSGMTQEQRDAAISSVFMEEAQRGVNAILGQGTDEIKDLENELYNAAGAAAEAREHMEGGLGGALRNMMSALEGAAIALGEALAPMITAAAEKVAELSQWFENLDSDTQQIIAVIGLAAAAVGPLLVAIGSLINSLSGVIPIIKAVGTALNFLTLNPIGLAITAIVLLAVVIFTYWDEIKAFTIMVWEAIKEFFIAFWEWLKEIFTTSVEAISNALTTAWQWIVDTTTSIWNSIKEFFISAWEAIKQTFLSALDSVSSFISDKFGFIFDAIKAIWENVKSFFQNIWEIIKNIFVGALLVVLQLITGRFEDARSSITQIWNNIKTAFQNVWNAIKNIFSTVLNTIRNLVSTIFNGIRNIITSIINGIRSTITSVLSSIRSTFSSIFNSIRSIASNVWNSIKSAISNAVNASKDAVVNGFNALRNAVSNTMNRVLSTIRNIWSKVTSFLSGINLASIGRNIIQGLINGVKEMAGKVVDSVKGVVDGAIKGAKSLLGINSPSKLFFQFGKWTDEGFIDGIAALTGKVKDAGEKMVGSIVPDDPKLAFSGRYDGIDIPDLPKLDVNSKFDTMPNSNNEKVIVVNNDNDGDNDGGSFVVEVPVNIDGKEVARAASPHIDKDLRNKSDRKAAAKGRRRRW